MKFLKSLFKTDCAECRQVRVYFWQRRCSFCDHNEGEVK
jgi:hypothetical protein